METFHDALERYDRKHGIRWDKATKELSSRGDVRREGKTAKLIGSSLRESFPDTIIKTHPRPRKR